jgi:hypothetical protein
MKAIRQLLKNRLFKLHSYSSTHVQGNLNGYQIRVDVKHCDLLALPELMLSPPNTPLVALELGGATWQGSYIAETLRLLLPWSGKQDVRYYLLGLAFYASGAVVACDGHRFAALFLGEVTEAPPVIAPRDSVALVLALAKELKAHTMAAVFGTRGARFKVADNVLVTVQLIEGRFPDVRRVLPKRHGPGAEITHCKATAAAFADMKSIKCREFEHTRVKDGRTYGPGLPTGLNWASSWPDLINSFNLDYLTALNGALKSKKGRLWVTENEALRVDTDDGLTFLMMPMRE